MVTINLHQSQSVELCPAVVDQEKINMLHYSQKFCFKTPVLLYFMSRFPERAAVSSS